MDGGDKGEGNGGERGKGKGGGGRGGKGRKYVCLWCTVDCSVHIITYCILI